MACELPHRARSVGRAAADLLLDFRMARREPEALIECGERADKMGNPGLSTSPKPAFIHLTGVGANH
jgi:hypothetical protein